MKYKISFIKNILNLLLAVTGELCVIYLSITYVLQSNGIKTVLEEWEIAIFVLNVPLLLWYIAFYFKKIRHIWPIHEKRGNCRFPGFSNVLFSGKDHENIRINDNNNVNKNVSSKINSNHTIFLIICILSLGLWIYNSYFFIFCLFPLDHCLLPILSSFIGIMACVRLFIVCIQDFVDDKKRDIIAKYIIQGIVINVILLIITILFEDFVFRNSHISIVLIQITILISPFLIVIFTTIYTLIRNAVDNYGIIDDNQK